MCQRAVLAALGRRSGFTAVEALVALAISAMVAVISLDAIVAYSSSVAAVVEPAALEAADAQVAQALVELRSAVEVVSISPGEIVVVANTNSAVGVTPTVGSAATGAYEVAYRFAGGALLRAAGPGVSWVPASPAPAAPGEVLPPLPAAPVYTGMAPVCASPCEDPTTATRAYYHTSASGVRNVSNPAGCAHAQGAGWDCDPGYTYPDGTILSASEQAQDVARWRAYRAAEDGYAQGQSTYAHQYSAYLSEIDAWNATAAAAVTASALPIGAWAPPAWTPSSWQVVAQGLVSAAFAGYDAAGAATTDASSIVALGVSVALEPGVPAESDMLTLRGTGGSTARAARPLTIPPAAPNASDPAAASEHNGWCQAHPGACG